ncbi:unnamed protein product [Brassica rapa subsp. narinosa]
MATMARSFLQAISKDEAVAPPLRVVQIEGLAVLKIIKHCKEFAPTLVTGQLLGLDVGSVLEVTNCFPFPVRDDDEEIEADGANYQLEMMRCLREVNVDNNTVGWYQSTVLGSYQTVELIETFMNYQENIKRCVCIIYDPSKADLGVLALKALKLSDSFMELYRGGNFTGEKLREKNFSWMDIFEEIPIKVSNSALVSAFMTELETDAPVSQGDYDRLHSSTTPFLENNMEFLIKCMDDLSMEQQKFQYYYRNLSRQQAQQQAWLQKRRTENMARRSAGEEPLPEEDPSNPIFKPIPEPSRLESFLITNQVSNFCGQINGYVNLLPHLDHSLPNTTTTMAVYHLLLSTSPSLALPPRRPNFNSILRTPAHPRLAKFPTSSPPAIRKTLVRSTLREDPDADNPSLLIGEDSAAFELGKQKLVSWVYFGVILGVVLYILNVVWIDNSTGFGKSYIDAVSTISGSPEVAMLMLILIFATVHSGLASLRDVGEKLIGERAFRVLFAGVSLPLAMSTIVFFINHRYDGSQLWQLQGVPGVHEAIWVANFVSFFFLYPSTFNLLEVAAVDKPKMHLWETGIMRITRHPQMVGQIVWCLAHTLWIGNSVAASASLGLIAHHLFGAWNGDRRLAKRYGDAFEGIKKRTSIVPFAAIIEGRQVLPEDYYKEFVRLPYLAITALTVGAYFAHPLMQGASFRLHW